MTAADLARLSTLLEQALGLPLTEREAWLATLDGEAAALAPTLRNLLARAASKETDDLLERGPAFTLAAGESEDGGGFVAGAQVGPYRLLRCIGQGGMGEVWLAERSDGQLKRSVALKLPMLGVRRSVLVQRFARERDILGALEHPHIARLYDAGLADDGQPYLALEYVEGLPVDQWCGQHRAGVQARLELLLQVAEAVAFAHSHLVLHRDLKPSNILVTAEAQVRLLDFGIAKLMEGETPAEETALTRLSGRPMTPAYASPEQIRGEPVGTASDVYSLGVVAYELLCGKSPYMLKRGSGAELEEAIVSADVPLASRMAADPSLARALRGDLDAILNHALHKQAQQRYPTVAALADDLQRHLRREPVHARPDGTLYRARRFIARNRLASIASTAVLLAIVAGSAAALWQARLAAEQAQQAEDVTRFMLDLVGSTDPDQGKGRNATTVEMLLGARARIESRFGNRPGVQVRLLSEVGYSLLGLGETDAAITLFEAAIDTAARHQQSEDPNALRAQLRLGEALITASRADEAKAPLARALQGLRRIDDVDGLIAALRWTSRMHSAKREPEPALAAAREAVALAHARLGPEQRQLQLNAELELLTALRIARQGGQLGPARRVYELTEALYPGRLVRPLLTARETYGSALVDEGDAAEGLKLLRSVLDDAVQLFGARDRMVGYFAGRLMSAQADVGDMAGALQSARLARRTWDDVHGERLHSDLAFGRYYEGTVLLASHRFAEAARLLLDGAELFERVQGPSSRIGALARAGASIALARQGDLAGAERVFGPPPAAIRTYEDAAATARLGQLRHLQGRTDEAASLLNAAADYLEHRTGDRKALALAQVWLAGVWVEQGRAQEAKALAESALSLYAPKQPGSSPAQAEAHEALARAELALGDASAAVRAASAAAAFWQGFDPATAAAVRARLLKAQALARLRDPQAAARAYQDALADASALRLDLDRQLLAQTAALLGPSLASQR